MTMRPTRSSWSEDVDCNGPELADETAGSTNVIDKQARWGRYSIPGLGPPVTPPGIYPRPQAKALSPIWTHYMSLK